MKLALFLSFISFVAFAQNPAHIQQSITSKPSPPQPQTPTDSVVSISLKAWQASDFKTYEKIKADAEVKTNALLEYVIKDSGVRFDTLKGLQIQDSILYLAIPRKPKPKKK